MRVGGRDTNQRIVQQRALAARRRHALREVARLARAEGRRRRSASTTTTCSKELRRQPGVPLPLDEIAGPSRSRRATASAIRTSTPTTRQFGIFAQDDWALTPRLTLNLGAAVGLRVGHAEQRLRHARQRARGRRHRSSTPAATSPTATIGRRSTAPWQPRVGFSYDVTGNGRTIAFGGWGRYYDRVLYNYTLDERFRLQYAVRTFRFSADGAPRDGNQTIVWDPSYLSAAGLDGLIAQRRRAEPRGLPDRQRDRAAGLRSVQPRRPPASRRRSTCRRPTPACAAATASPSCSATAGRTAPAARASPASRTS